MTRPKQPKKRFTSEEQILKKIDWCQAKHRQLIEAANKAETWGKKILCSPSSVDRENAIAAIEDAKKMRQQAEALIESRSKKLGKRLAEFRTAIMPGIVEDGSMPVKLG